MNKLFLGLVMCGDESSSGGDDNPVDNPLTFKMNPVYYEDGDTSQVSLYTPSGDNDDVWFKTDTSDWCPYISESVIVLSTLDSYVSFRNFKSFIGAGSAHFTIKGASVDASGNVGSLINYDELYARCFAYLFSDCSSLCTPPELPYTKLAESCYEGMFELTSIETPPILPALVMQPGCYYKMFHDCSQLQFPPELPAEELANNCYTNMFAWCGTMSLLPSHDGSSTMVLPASEVPPFAYSGMFAGTRVDGYDMSLRCEVIDYAGCSGMFTDDYGMNNAPNIESVCVLAESSFEGMFQGCIQMLEPPVLPSLDVAPEYCYASMFRECVRLLYAPELTATDLMDSCYSGMFADCASMEVGPSVLPARYLAPLCYNEMFFGCSAMVEAPEIMAEYVEVESLYFMFTGCSSLSYMKVHFTRWLGDEIDSDGSQDWVMYVAEYGVFEHPAGLDVIHGPSAIPVGWETLVME